MPNSVFAFGEAEIVAKPSGLASQTLGYALAYSLGRTPVLDEDGSASLYQDRFSIESPWVDDDVRTIFFSRGPFDLVMVRWRNADDLRLMSDCVTGARCTAAEKRPGQGGVETYQFQFESVSKA